MNNLLLTPAQVSEFLGVTIGTLSVWRCTGRYPLSFIKVGRRVMYRQSDVESFVEGRVYEHTL
ncbi:excisionase [Shewanella sp. UCD-FRSSP16_17]|uniref:helix-turn-helix domain-containing protein n=1 Tax=Shewanella sp. UCD-FRSSP16_17 TaxID=1853256 RepID=UPI0007EED1F7|nr:helix-turn-helix domain-containing protein [Shewanella sp. UCD-FRSSP16_17]OBT10368.1 excisionase [Shewanella sp. UCD-FRSSP16_17]